MRTAKLVEAQKIALFEETDLTMPRVGEAIVRVKACGICGTDMHIFKGKREDVKLPRVMGHELSGYVTAVGEGVRNVKVGDRVVFDPVMSCGVCPTCKKGHRNVCAKVKCFGVQMDGGFQDYIAVPASQLYAFPEKFSYETAALAEPFSVAANILSRANAVAGEKIVIIGAGTIGLCILQAAKGLGCEVLIGDIVEKKLRIAETFGADAVINSAEADFAAEVERFAPYGADIVIDAVGATPLMEQSLRLTAPGTRVVVISFDNHPAAIVPADITKKELTIIGSRMNQGKFPLVIEWMRDGVIDPEKMVEQVYPLEEIQTAFERATSDGTLKKVVISL